MLPTNLPKLACAATPHVYVRIFSTIYNYCGIKPYRNKNP